MDGEDSYGLELPAYAAGGRVERTGIALVHEGEYIVPAAGSEAMISSGAAEGTVVNFYFPVQVEVVGCLPDEEVQRVAEHVFAELDRELATRV
ncbi:hypothetical protein [Dactylosporangium sp. CA-092794]|uniref:hypothetical protein n=1 Tax=Dactylosporangium sp. CA-092794 TaxID=3239929 RepID=UPI003D9152ED